MAKIKPFQCIRPAEGKAAQIAALPYDVYNRREAEAVVKKNPLSFLRIDRAETAFGEEVGEYDDRVYQKARELLQEMIHAGDFIKDSEPAYYLYGLTMNGRTQIGLVACASIDDYDNNVIKKHENTRQDKELDRIRHVDTCSAQTGPIFLTYRKEQTIEQITKEVVSQKPLYDFLAEDGIRHQVWKLAKPERIEAIQKAFSHISDVYIADGHHRAASAVKVGKMRREQYPNYTGEEEFNYFLSVLFPHDQLMILDYNRLVKDLHGYTTAQFLEKVAQNFSLEKVADSTYRPEKKGHFGMYLEGVWYKLCAKESICSTDPVEGLDVSVLQNALLGPILGIQDPKTDQRIDFVGGIRGAGELEERTRQDMKVAFLLYPTSIEELLAVADAGRLMPPKSTWFEPKLRSGLFIHEIEPIQAVSRPHIVEI